MQRAMRQAIESAHIEPDAIDAVYASASGSPRLDRLEFEALGAVLGERVEAGVPIVAVKGAVGECYGATSFVQIASALHAMGSGALPLAFPARPQALGRTAPRHVLINAFDAIGTQRSLVLARP
jgi:3-oxoacyl-(acyl-carrier-protein) synthase